MAGLKSLVKDTAIYGLSSIVGRFLNWCLVPLYTHLFASEEYGVVTYLYAWVALLLTLLTYGMETGFFRFAGNPLKLAGERVYTTALSSLAVTSSVFIAAVCLFSPEIAHLCDCPGHPSYIWMMGITVGVDAFCSLPFGYLRYHKRPVRFAVLKFTGIGVNIGLNLFFLLLCPKLVEWVPQLMGWYVADFGIGYIFLSNLASTLITFLMLAPQIRVRHGWRFSQRILRRMLAYSWPLLILGIAGVLNQSVATLLFPKIAGLPPEEAMMQLGIYNANFKIAIVMVMFTQAFRFAFEPFIFARASENDGPEAKLRTYADATKYFIIAGIFIFLAVMFYLPVLKYFIAPSYFSGMAVVPVVMMAELFFGVVFNLSMWYKLTDRTIWGTYFSIGGLVITVALNLLLVPRIGYMGCAWASFFCYGVMMVGSYIAGQHYFPIPYQLRRIGGYALFASALYAAAVMLDFNSVVLTLGTRTLLLAVFGAAVMKFEKIPVRR